MEWHEENATEWFDSKLFQLYLAGKGDGNIRYYEIVDEAPYIHYLNQFISGHPQKALGSMPKRGLNTSICEIFRFYKLHAAGNICEPIAMIVPRKSTMFQTDLYPDTACNVPAISAKEWFQGRNVSPKLMSMSDGVINAIENPVSVNIDIKNRINLQHQEKAQHIQSQTIIERKQTYNSNVKNTNGISKNKENEDNKFCDNNSKKFAFLSQQTIPDYRTQVNLSLQCTLMERFCCQHLSHMHIISADDWEKSENIDQSKYEIPSVESDLRTSGTQ